jgi:hypothetical protein
MNMVTLMEELDEFFKICTASDLFALFKLYKLFGHQSGLLWCKKQVCEAAAFFCKR